MKTWTIKKRIIIGFAILLTLVAGLAVTSFFLLRQVKQEADFMNVDALPGLTVMAEIRGTVSDIQIKVLQILVLKDPAEQKRIEEEVVGMRAHTLKLMADYEKTISLAEDRETFRTMEQARDTYVETRSRLFKLVDAGKTQEANAFFTATVRPAYETYQAIIGKMFEFDQRNAVISAEKANTVAKHASSVTSIISVIVIVLGTVFAAVIVTGLNRVLTRVANTLNEGAHQVAAAAGQVSVSSQSLAEGSTEQAASLEETSSSLEEMASMTNRNSDSATQANQLTQHSRQVADAGAGDMQAMNAAMLEIKASSDDIAKIIKTIDEIAFQTNILALNAAVEAARAGDAGMGFAVVAEEVRNLAQRSAQAARETAAKIEGAIGKSAQGVQISERVAKSLAEIVESVRKVDALVSEVNTASREQSQGVQQINTAVSQMDKVVQSNAAAAEESASAAEELNAQAAALTEGVAELMQLVGQSAVTANPAASAASHPAPVVARKPEPKRLRPVAPRAEAPAGRGLTLGSNQRATNGVEHNGHLDLNFRDA